MDFLKNANNSICYKELHLKQKDKLKELRVWNKKVEKIILSKQVKINKPQKLQASHHHQQTAPDLDPWIAALALDLLMGWTLRDRRNLGDISAAVVGDKAS